MKNTKCYLIGLFLISHLLGNPLYCAAAHEKASDAAHANPSQELLKIIAFKNAKAEKSEKNRGALGKMYHKAKKMVQSPVNSIFGKKPSKAKKAFYVALGTVIFLIATYGVHEFWSVMTVLKNDEKAGNSIPKTNNVIEQEQGDGVLFTNEPIIDTVTSNSTPDQTPPINQALPIEQDDVRENAPEEQYQKNIVTDNPEKKVMAKEPENVVGGKATSNNKPNNDDDSHQDTNRTTQDVSVPDDSNKEDLSIWQRMYDGINRFVNEPRQEQPDSEIQPKAVVLQVQQSETTKQTPIEPKVPAEVQAEIPAVQSQPKIKQTSIETKTPAVVSQKEKPVIQKPLEIKSNPSQTVPVVSPIIEKKVVKVSEVQPNVVVPPAQSKSETEQQNQSEVKVPEVAKVPVKNEPSENATKEEPPLKKEQEGKKVSNLEQSSENTVSTTGGTWKKELLGYAAVAVVAVAVGLFESWSS